MGENVFKRIAAVIFATTVSVTSIIGCGIEKNGQSSIVDSTNVTMQSEETKKKREVKLQYTSEYLDCYKDEINEKIQVLDTKINNETISYIFITDLHMDNTDDALAATYRQLYAVVDLANNSDVDFVCVGGDFTDGRHAEENGKQNCMDLVDSVSTILEKCNKPVFLLKGNHDDNSFSAQRNEDLLFNPDFIMTRDEWYSVTMKHFSQYATGYQDGYYYYDFPEKKVRVICLNMSDSTDKIDPEGKRYEMGMYYYGFKDDQVEWLAKTAFSKDDWNYIVLSHDSFGMESQYGTGDKTNFVNIENIIKAANTHTKFESSIVTKDFSKMNIRVLAYNAGHLHVMGRSVNSEMGNLPMINTEVAKASNSKGGNWGRNIAGMENFLSHPRELNSINEACFDIVVINENTGVTDVLRFGAGEDETLIP